MASTNRPREDDSSHMAAQARGHAAIFHDEGCPLYPSNPEGSPWRATLLAAELAN